MEDLGRRYENVRVWSMPADGLRRHGCEWVWSSASQLQAAVHLTPIERLVSMWQSKIKPGCSSAEWKDWFNLDLNWPGTSDAWWHFFLPCSVANVLWLRRRERCHDIVVFYLVGKTTYWNMCYVVRLLTAVSFFTGGTDIFVETYSLYFYFFLSHCCGMCNWSFVSPISDKRCSFFLGTIPSIIALVVALLGSIKPMKFSITTKMTPILPWTLWQTSLKGTVVHSLRKSPILDPFILSWHRLCISKP